MTTQPVRVVSGVLRRADGQFFVAQRSDPRHAGCWEFPGGKVEPGEADTDALIREWQEELGVDISGYVGGWVFSGRFPHPANDGREFELHAYMISHKLLDGALPSPKECHSATMWASREVLEQLPPEARMISLLPTIKDTRRFGGLYYHVVWMSRWGDLNPTHSYAKAVFGSGDAFENKPYTTTDMQQVGLTEEQSRGEKYRHQVAYEQLDKLVGGSDCVQLTRVVVASVHFKQWLLLEREHFLGVFSSVGHAQRAQQQMYPGWKLRTSWFDVRQGEVDEEDEEDGEDGEDAVDDADEADAVDEEDGVDAPPPTG